MTIKLEGNIRYIFELETRTNFSFRRIWMDIEQDTQYPQTVEIQASGKALENIDSLKVGDRITAECNLRGKVFISRENKESLFQSLNLWKYSKS